MAEIENAKSAEERPEGKREAGIGQHAAIFSIEALYVMLRGEEEEQEKKHLFYHQYHGI